MIDGFGTKWATKVDMPLNKETKSMLPGLLWPEVVVSIRLPSMDRISKLADRS